MTKLVLRGTGHTVNATAGLPIRLLHPIVESLSARLQLVVKLIRPPARTSSTNCSRKAGGYCQWLRGIVDSFLQNSQVSTEAGQLQNVSRRIN
jgi:hypothetical protein